MCVEGDASCQMECPTNVDLGEPPVTAASWKSTLSMRKGIHLMGKSDWNYTELMNLCLHTFS